MYNVKFADIGEGLTEGKVAEVLVKVGQTIKEGDSLFFVETDKVNSEIPSPVAGVISQLNIKENQNIMVGDTVVIIDDGSSSSTVAQLKKEVRVEKEINASVVGSTPISNEVISRDAPKQTVDLSNNQHVKASPLARKVATEKGINLSQISGTGPNGRILVEDINSNNTNKNQVEPVTTNAVNKKTVSIDSPLTWTETPMNGIRKAIAKAMERSSSENAAFTGMSNIDITPTYDMRNQLKDHATKNGIKLTYLAFIVKAAANVLQEMPNINARINKENNSILSMHNINIGIAVDTPKGLMVPVIKGVNHLSVFEIANQITDLAARAKAGKLSMKEMSEGTFTISNFGSVGLDYATPIINSPEASILGVGNMVKTPIFVGDEIKAGWIMPFSMTCDHRIIDGGDAGRFLMKLKAYLQAPALLFI
ncbi:dihydrolipoamide acetyltransferase family protein [Spiroplasma endosymbiont of Othius punctulatus]|uniref:dihydrolipoamide acetyltransferase family protein n=1 Tax=Spiroplasma endosymbiont of Othius punctulatus TaxID=3066289 RepID=UPI0030D52BF6